MELQRLSEFNKIPYRWLSYSICDVLRCGYHSLATPFQHVYVLLLPCLWDQLVHWSGASIEIKTHTASYYHLWYAIKNWHMVILVLLLKPLTISSRVALPDISLLSGLRWIDENNLHWTSDKDMSRGIWPKVNPKCQPFYTRWCCCT